MTKIPVIYLGKEYMLLYQYASGYCEIVSEEDLNHKIEIVHFSELTLKGA